MIGRFVFAMLPFYVNAYAQAPEPISREISNDVTVERDLVYASYADRDLRLDLYRPADRGEALLATIVVIRGGGSSAEGAK